MKHRVKFKAITYRGDVIGVICIENLTSRVWTDAEINFARTLSSLYAFAYSIKQNDLINDNFEEFEKKPKNINTK